MKLNFHKKQVQLQINVQVKSLMQLTYCSLTPLMLDFFCFLI